MRTVAGALLVAAAAAAWPAPARAQDSVFGIRGLGFLDTGVSPRSAGLGGGDAILDGESTVNPAAIASWTETTGWAAGSASSRSFEDASLRSTRFPLFGLTAQAGPRLVVAVTASDYLDRNWSVAQTDSGTPVDSTLVVSDLTRSLGGVTDVRFAAAYRLTGLALGAGLHVLTGSAETTVLRQFTSDSAFLPFSDQSITSYRGVAASFGAVASPLPQFVLGASVRVSGRMRAEAPDTTTNVPMPVEVHAGASVQPMAGLGLDATVGWANWSRSSAALVAAGQAGARDAWSVAVGAGLSVLRLGRRAIPLRFGYEWRQLPFLIPDTSGALALSEHAVTFGFGFTAAGGRATVDVAEQWGARVAGPLRETFATTQVGLTVRP